MKNNKITLEQAIYRIFDLFDDPKEVQNLIDNDHINITSLKMIASKVNDNFTK